jgi:photosystem II stability/assembly factor-like uncharacterized protein
VGGAGTLTQTFDEVSWATRSIASRDLYAVTCVGNYDGWAAGEGGLVAHTFDGGQTWSSQDAHTSASLRAIRFGTAMLGLVAGDAGALAVTRDGGSTWTTQGPWTGASLRGVAVASNAGMMIAVGDGGVVLRSPDAGGTWKESPIAGAGDLQGVASDPGAHRVLAVDASGSIWSSTDAGVHFAREVSAGAGLNAVAMTDDGTLAIVAGARGTVLESEDGAAWRTVPTNTKVDLRAALITGEGGARHYVAGDSGTLLASSNRGASWSPVAIATSAPLYGLDDL